MRSHLRVHLGLGIASLIFSQKRGLFLEIFNTIIKSLILESLILDYKLLSLDSADDRSYDSIFGHSVLAKNSTLLAFFKYLNPVTYFARLDPVIMFVVLSLGLCTSLLVGLSLLWFGKVRHWSWIAESQKPQVPFYFGLIRTCISFSDGILALYTMSLSKAFTCGIVIKQQ